MSKPKSFYGPANGSQPGQYPYTSGVYEEMYRQRHWTMRQYAGFGTAAESNQRFHYLLNQGVTGLSVAFDLPTQIGYDSDHPIASGEVGRVGVAISSLADMEILLQNIPLDQVSTSMTINATAPILLAMYIAVARKTGIGTDRTGSLADHFYAVIPLRVVAGGYHYPSVYTFERSGKIYHLSPA